MNRYWCMCSVPHSILYGCCYCVLQWDTAPGLNVPAPISSSLSLFDSLFLTLTLMHAANQDKLRDLGGVPELLNLFFYEENNPFLREWTVVAVRNACECNPANQVTLSPSH